jgi:hypothetical protein
MNLRSRLAKLERAVSDLLQAGATPGEPTFYDIFEYQDGSLVFREDFPLRFPTEAKEWDALYQQKEDAIEARLEEELRAE